jgi:hypothetical protein
VRLPGALDHSLPGRWFRLFHFGNFDHTPVEYSFRQLLFPENTAPKPSGSPEGMAQAGFGKAANQRS